MKLLFLHGWKSTVGGLKPTFLKEQGHEVLNPALPDDDFEESVRIAEAEFNEHRPDLIVGSSRGAAVALNMKSGEVPLVLLCPAWKNWGTASTVRPNTIILHSRQDDVVPFEHSEELLANSSLPPQTLWEVGQDHRLADQQPLEAILDAIEQLAPAFQPSILDHPAISGSYLFPQPRYIDDPFLVEVDGAKLACCHRLIDPDAFTLIHFHGNGEAVEDYVPFMADFFEKLGLNSLFVEYREYGASTGKAQLVAMLGDGEAAMQAADVAPETAIVFGRSIGSLYAIELARRQPTIAGLILESGIADASQRFLTYADLQAAGLNEQEVLAEARRYFDHQKKLSQYTRPLLILHTEFDGLVDIDHAERNYQWAGSTQKRFVRFPLGNHNTIFATNMKAYLDALGQFAESVRS